MDRDGIGLEVLAAPTCVELLRSRSIGRVGLSEKSLPVVLPVRYVVWDDMVVLRTGPSAAATSLIDSVVAFEVDHFDDDAVQGWSVMVQGHAKELVGVRSLGPDEDSVLGSWPAPHDGLHVCIPMTVLSGHRLTGPSERVAR